MSEFPWLPIGFDLGGGAASGRLIAHGPGYQVIGERNGSGSILLIDPADMPESPALERLTARATGVTFGSIQLWSVRFQQQSEPFRLGEIERRITGISDGLLLKLTRCLRRLQAESPDACWENVLLIRSESMDCLPT